MKEMFTDLLDLITSGIATIGNMFPTVPPIPHYTTEDAWQQTWQDFKQSGDDLQWAIQQAGAPNGR